MSKTDIPQTKTCASNQRTRQEELAQKLTVAIEAGQVYRDALVAVVAELGDGAMRYQLFPFSRLRVLVREHAPVVLKHLERLEREFGARDLSVLELIDQTIYDLKKAQLRTVFGPQAYLFFAELRGSLK